MATWVDIRVQMQGRWRGVLAALGMSQKQLSGKHGPCPMCGGVDRFRFDNKGGSGTWICNQCGAGDGVNLVMAYKGWTFAEAVKEIRALLRKSEPERVDPGMSENRKRELRRELWSAARQVVTGDPVDQYLAGRGIERPTYSPALRYHPSARHPCGKEFPCMVAAVQDPGGQGVSLHRTFILDGEKAPVDNPRMLMPGEIPDGSAIRLSPVTSTLGVAEGIETALAAWEIFGTPTWATTSAGILVKWTPPDGVKRVIIYGDNDRNFTGQSAAYMLAKNLSRMKLEVDVQIPGETGTDWCDHVGGNDA